MSQSPVTSELRSPIPPPMSELSQDRMCRSVTSGTSIGLTSSASITSSRTEDSADEEGRRKVSLLTSVLSF